MDHFIGCRRLFHSTKLVETLYITTLFHFCTLPASLRRSTETVSTSAPERVDQEDTQRFTQWLQKRKKKHAGRLSRENSRFHFKSLLTEGWGKFFYVHSTRPLNRGGLKVFKTLHKNNICTSSQNHSSCSTSSLILIP